MRHPVAEYVAKIAKAMREQERIIKRTFTPSLAELLGVPPSLPESKPKPSRRKPPPLPTTYPAGDGRWLRGKKSISRLTAAGYLGVTLDWVRKLIASEHLNRHGPNVTTHQFASMPITRKMSIP
jgi:hypothetical protein